MLYCHYQIEKEDCRHEQYSALDGVKEMCLDIYNISMVNNAPHILFHDNQQENQNFFFHDSRDGYFAIMAKFLCHLIGFCVMI